MTREKELQIILNQSGADSTKAAQLIDEIVFLETQLRVLKKLPFIRVNDKDPSKQKSTPAARQYKEMLQQYNNTLKLFLKICGDFGDDQETESPLRAWLRKQNNEMESGQ